MAFSDPISITVAGNAKSMPRVSTGNFTSTYTSADENWSVTISHQKVAGGQKLRSLVKFRQRKVATDPLTSAQDYAFNDWMLINERPVVGFTSTEVNDQKAGLFTWFDATIGGKFYGQES